MYIPQKTVCKHSKPFWSKQLSTLSQALQKAQTNFKYRSDPRNKEVLQHAKSAFQESLISEKNSWIHNKLEGLNTKQSIDFWKRYKKQFVKKGNNHIGHIFTDMNKLNLTFDDAKKEEILYNTFFTGQHLQRLQQDVEHCSHIDAEVETLKQTNWGLDGDNASLVEPEETSPHDMDTEELCAEFLNQHISYEEVCDSIKVQKTASKCNDGDGFHPLILKKLPPAAIEYLTYLFNRVFSTGEWAWDKSMVTFIKKADKDSYLLPGSYRPITIASYVGKIFERILQKRLILYCQKKNIIDPSQEGFLPRKNTTRYLYKMTAAVEEARRRRLSTMLLFLDFEKAFDSVPISALIFKLNMYGVSGPFLQIIHAFLTSRQITLKVNDFIGPTRRTGLFGLPQGSVLSPLLFIIYVSDLLSHDSLPSDLSGDIQAFKYADDGTVLVAEKSTTEAYQVMKKVCDYLAVWCSKWGLLINCNRNKTEVIIIKSKDSANTVIPKLSIGGNTIEYVEKSKVLGVLVDHQIKFDFQARAVLSKCWNEWHRLSLGTTRKRGLNNSSLAIIFKTAVLTKLMYAAPVWLANNVNVFNNLWARVLLKVTGS